jgi:AcrR family transcriptional regulator
MMMCFPMRGEATTSTGKRSESRSLRQARIEKAAEQVFALHGVAAATMDDIARHCGVSKGALYLHFESKEQLYLLLAVRALRELLTRINALPQVGSGFERLSVILRTYAEYSVSDPARFRLAGAWIAADWRWPQSEPLAVQYEQLVKEGLRYAVQAFELGKRDGTIQPTLDIQFTILHVIGSMHGLSALYAKLVDESEQLPPQLDSELWGGLMTSTRSAAELRNDRQRIVESYVQLVLSAIEKR